MELLINLMLFGACHGYGLCVVLWVKYRSTAVKDYNFLHLLVWISSFLFLHYLYFNSLYNDHRVVIFLVSLLLMLILRSYIKFLESNGLKDTWTWNRLLWILVGGFIVGFVPLRISLLYVEYPLLETLFFEVIQGITLVYYIIFLLRIRKHVFHESSLSYIKFIHGFFIFYTLSWVVVLAFQYADLNFENDYLFSIYFQMAPFAGLYLIGYYLIFNRNLHKVIERNPIVVQMSDHAAKLKKAVLEDELFLNPNLTLTTLAHSCNISTKSTTMILKNEFKMGFYDFINHFRLEYFLQQVEKMPHLKHEAIAVSSGFKNKATFYNAFKKRFGTSPKKYLER